MSMTKQNASRPEAGTVYLVGAGPGDPELITLKAVRVLRDADVVLYDRLVNPELLEFADSATRTVAVGKQSGKPSISQHDINKLLVEHALAGKHVVRLKGGDPFIFGRGGEECLALTRHGIAFEVVPGISSALSAPAYAGIPLTQRKEATSFTVVSGHLDPGSDPYDWQALAGTSTLVIMMGLRNLDSLAEKLITHGKAADTPAAVIQWGTTQKQQVASGTLADIAEQAKELESPATTVIGDVAGYHEALNWFTPAPDRADTLTESLSAAI